MSLWSDPAGPTGAAWVTAKATKYGKSRVISLTLDVKASTEKSERSYGWYLAQKGLAIECGWSESGSSVDAWANRLGKCDITCHRRAVTRITCKKATLKLERISTGLTSELILFLAHWLLPYPHSTQTRPYLPQTRIREVCKKLTVYWHSVSEDDLSRTSVNDGSW